MPDKYFVVDTNVVISIAVFSSFSPALALEKILSLGVLAFSEEVLQEYAETLSRNKFDKYISIEKRLTFLQKLIEHGSLIPVTSKIEACRDPKDDKYLELAIEC
ncbi:MAG: putative toxin-antitoxin system toxin component, PIN family, partial [Mucilaginibacter sp.]